MAIRFDFKLAHPDYPALIERQLTALVRKYPQAKLTRVSVAPPRRENDISMGFYNEDDQSIAFNEYWFGQPLRFLAKAAKTPPLFHGLMVEEPAHVVVHEGFHAIQQGYGFKNLDERARKVWEGVTRDPGIAPAQYALTNPIEFYAELGACVELDLATDQQRDQFSWIMDGVL